jgi:hypothetical protein
MSMIAIGAGVAVSAVGTVGGALLSNAMTPKPPTPDTKGATKGVNKAIAGYDDAISRYEGEIGKYLAQIESIAGTISAPQVDWMGAANEALRMNEQNNKRFTRMAGNQSMSGTESLLAQQRAADPMFDAKRDQADTNNLAMMKGEVPIDVQQTLARSGAFQALQGGFGGSGMDRAMRARDMGLTSLDMSQTGEANAQRWSALLNEGFVRPAFVSPFQVMQFSGVSSGQAIDSAFRQGDMDFRANLAGVDLRANAAGNALGAHGTALGARGNIFNVASGMPIQMMQADYKGAQNAWQAKAQQAQAMGQAVSSAAGAVGGGISGFGYHSMMNQAAGSAVPAGTMYHSTSKGLESAVGNNPNAGFTYSATRGWTPRALGV